MLSKADKIWTNSGWVWRNWNEDEWLSRVCPNLDYWRSGNNWLKPTPWMYFLPNVQWLWLQTRFFGPFILYATLFYCYRWSLRWFPVACLCAILNFTEITSLFLLTLVGSSDNFSEYRIGYGGLRPTLLLPQHEIYQFIQYLVSRDSFKSLHDIFYSTCFVRKPIVNVSRLLLGIYCCKWDPTPLGKSFNM